MSVTVGATVPPAFAPITVLPVPTVVARPAAPAPLAMVATLAEDELQCVFSVMSCVLESLNVPVAVNCCVLPTATFGAVGVIAIDDSVALLTVSVVVPVTPEALAEIVTEPSFLPFATPVERTFAMFGWFDFHVRPLRLVATLASLKVPLAVNLINVCRWIVGLAGLMAMLTRCAVETVSVVEPLTDPKVAAIVVVPVATLEARP